VAEVRGINSEVVSLILFGRGERQRFTQETPILPDVWQMFAKRPADRHDLLISPLESCSAIRVLRQLMSTLPREVWPQAELAPLQSFVAARLNFHELIRHVLPYTRWTVEARGRFEKVDSPLPFDAGEAFDQVYDSALGRARGEKPVLRGQLFEIARILTLIAAIYVSENPEIPEIGKVEDLAPMRGTIVETIVSLIGTLNGMGHPPALIGQVTSNRPVMQATLSSRATVKADAASRLFDVQCKQITWGVLDSGIDRNHAAFKRKDRQDGESASRVIRTYELGILRALLNAAYMDEPEANPILALCIAGSGLSKTKAVRYLKRAYRAYQPDETEMLDWSSIEPLLRVEDPDAPADGHGTHVAGIIGADWSEEGVRGLCPDIQLMDFRIIGNEIDETEFAVLGALQLVRYLNSHNQHIVVHGVNLSLALEHKVGSFACGRTPVCNECERLVGAGVTVVAAAGNEGYHKYETGKGAYSGYAALSITDPGNAEDVITVGATHKHEPHAYGVSYFSSRGPTGDGRMKPDLVAPGERIISTLPDDELGPLDGTSQAAPHVSAAAAMLMARYPELNRSPRRIKRILCESATDLGRERAFQGYGLLDILRALQSF
jgi:subtilisin family serine protease